MLALNQITLRVKDFAANKAFFQRLGLELIVDAPPRYARFRVPGNNATLSVETTQDAETEGCTAQARWCSSSANRRRRLTR